MTEYKKEPKSNADTLCKTRAKGGENVHIGPRGGRRGRLVEPGWEVAQSLFWILLVNVIDSILDLRDLLPLYVQVDANTFNILGVVLVQQIQADTRYRQLPQLIAL